MRFRVLEGQEPRPVELAFGRPSDIALLREWRLPPKLRHHEPARDAVEFARLATKRWRYHRRPGHVATSLAEIRTATARASREELAFLLLARAEWSSGSPILGLAHCRRTWCGHLFLDFLSVHPRIVTQEEPRIRAVGIGILYGWCEIAGRCGVPVVWGEATASSAAFYCKAIGHSAVLDCFQISGARLARCRREFRRMRTTQA